MKGMIMATLLSLVAASGIYAQSAEDGFTVTGIVADSLTREGEAYATVKIAAKAEPDKALRTLLTGKDGTFRTTVNGVGNMTLTVSSMGRRPVVRDFEAAVSGGTVSLDTLLIAAAGNELQQLVVTAQKPLVKTDIDKITYSIEDDPDSKSNTLIDMLRKVPMVMVDGEDNIKVNGQSSFKVYVNGRPNKMMSDNPKEVLRSLPANSVKRIEVITNPGPKYDAEGVGGILNIITTGSGMEGYTVTLRGDANNNGLGGGVFGTVKSGRLTVSARYNYNYGDRPPTSSGGTRVTTGDISEMSSDLEYSNESKSYTHMHNGSLEASYEIDTLRLVSAELGLWGYDSRDHSMGTTLATMPATADVLYGYSQGTRSHGSRFSVNGGIDYQRSFAGVKDRMLTLSYRISTNPQTSDSYSDYIGLWAVDSWQDFISRMTAQRNDGHQNTEEHTFQVDFTTPVAKIHTVEAGVKYIIRSNRSENDRYESPAEGGGYQPDTDHSSHYKHRNDIAAAYAGYGLKTGKWSARLGLRYEHTMQKVEYLLGRGSDFSKSFDDVVPSASLGYAITDMSNVRLGYTMRIYRPGIWYLNPYLDDSNPTTISQGNPDLTSQRTHSFSLSYSRFTQKFNVNLSAGYSFVGNSIESVSELVSDVSLVEKGLQNPTGKEVIYSTYRNIGRMRSFDLNGYANWNATSSTRIYTNIYGRYSYLSDGQRLSNEGWFMYVNAGVQQTLPKDWNIGLNTFYQTPWIMLQGKGNKWFDYGLSVNKSFMSKRLTLSAFANNVFSRHIHTGWSEQSPDFATDNYFRMQVLRYGVSVNLRIGELKASVKKAERTITNDDVKEGEKK